MQIATGWQRQKSIINALFLRELKARFTSGQAGLFWTFFQPFFMVLIFILIHILMLGGGSATSSTYNYSVFLVISFTAFLFFRDTINKSAGAFTANKGLFVYRQLKPIDAMAARLLVEVFIMSIVMIIFIAVGLYLDYGMQAKNLGMVFVGYIWLIIFSFGIGLNLAVAGVFYDFVGKITGYLSLPLMFLSAVFYSMQSIYQVSSDIGDMMLYNPIVHFMEMIRGGFFYDLDDRYVDYNYMMLWTAVTLFSGLWLYIALEKRIISR